jgi:hypothetical protein
MILVREVKPNKATASIKSEKPLRLGRLIPAGVLRLGYNRFAGFFGARGV